ncbi:MAG: hypothetical protein LQ342_005443 [Letrouitia transgressa]|nr:MAG: hypothetical protein LQ342_005443 [Letrouitia transgressa]
MLKMLGNELPYLKAPQKAGSTYLQGMVLEIRSKEYEYSLLQRNQFRLLKVTVEPRTSYLICNFEVRDLATSRGEFIAISYCWGDPRPTHRILTGDGRFLVVTESATEVLRFVVSKYPSHSFWIDQLCINQTHLEEKSVQVSMMGQIYSSTIKVVAWLGRGDRLTRDVVTFIRRVSADTEKRKARGIQPTITPTMSVSPRLRDAPAQLRMFRNWDLLSMLLKNPWFERIWVMQEIVMACSATSRIMKIDEPVLLMFEECAIEFDVLASFLRFLKNNKLQSNLAFDRKYDDGFKGSEMPFGFGAVDVFSQYRNIKEQEEDISMNLALNDAWYFKASNDRDKVFATMGFIDPNEIANTDLHIDYESSVQEGYTRCAIAMLRRDNEYPMLLHMAGIGLRRSYLALPSWVPDFSQESYEVQLKPEVSESEEAKHYLASGIIKKIELHIDASARSLHCRGIFIDVVETVYEQPTFGKSNQWYHNFTPSLFFSPDKYYYKKVLQWLEDIEAFLSASGYSHSRDILYQTLVGDYSIPFNSSDFNLGEIFDSWYQAQHELAGSIGIKTSVLSSFKRKPDSYNKVQLFEDLKASSQGGRPVFGTSDKRMLGHGPTGLKAGDTVCIIMGVMTPFLLRPMKSESGLDGVEGKRYQLVGPCFVHGIMYGEGLNIGQLEDIVLV